MTYKEKKELCHTQLMKVFKKISITGNFVLSNKFFLGAMISMTQRKDSENELVTGLRNVIFNTSLNNLILFRGF